MRGKPILCLDFDGVIHRYDSKWQGATVIPDDATPGFFGWVLLAAPHFELVIYSSRSKEPGGIDAMKAWLRAQYLLWVTEAQRHSSQAIEELFTFAHEKPPAFLTIDDRCVRFDGNWAALPPATLRTFQPWNRKPAS